MDFAKRSLFFYFTVLFFMQLHGEFGSDIGVEAGERAAASGKNLAVAVENLTIAAERFTIVAGNLTVAAESLKQDLDVAAENLTAAVDNLTIAEESLKQGLAIAAENLTAAADNFTEASENFMTALEDLRHGLLATEENLKQGLSVDPKSLAIVAENLTASSEGLKTIAKNIKEGTQYCGCGSWLDSEENFCSILCIGLAAIAVCSVIAAHPYIAGTVLVSGLYCGGYCPYRNDVAKKAALDIKQNAQKLTKVAGKTEMDNARIILEIV